MKKINSNQGICGKTIRIICSLIALFLISDYSKAATYNVSVQDYSFSPKNIHALVGDTVMWMWSGPHSHTTTCDGIASGTSLPHSAVPWDVTLNSENPSFKYILSEAGIYNYVSKEYSEVGMTGKINVEITLPVELTDFVATTIKNEVILDWFTGGEINNDRFEIQRVDLSGTKGLGPDDMPFYTIGVLSGNGNSTSINHYKFIDRNLKSGRYLYRLKQIDFNSNFVFHLLPDEVVIGIPDMLKLSQNYPNPFNPVTKINFELPEDGLVNIIVYDVNGKTVMDLLNEFRPSGYQSLDLNGSSLSSGVYYYRFNFKGSSISESFTKKMMLVK